MEIFRDTIGLGAKGLRFANVGIQCKLRYDKNFQKQALLAKINQMNVDMEKQKRIIERLQDTH